MEFQEGTLLLEPRNQFDPCLVGVDYFTGRAIYDFNKIIQVIMSEETDEGLTDDEKFLNAVDHFNFNFDYKDNDRLTPIYLSLSEGKFVGDIVE